MFDDAHGLDTHRLDSDSTLAAVEANERELAAAEYRRLALAAHWADLHGFVDERSAALPGAERLVAIGGDGTPEVAEFCPAELGAVLGVSTFAATSLIADALDLRYRLPILWERIRSGEVKPFLGRRVAVQTRPLNQDAAALVDAKVARWCSVLTWARLGPVEPNGQRLRAADLDLRRTSRPAPLHSQPTSHQMAWLQALQRPPVAIWCEVVA